LAISEIADDEFMQKRVTACVIQQLEAGNTPKLAMGVMVVPGVLPATDWVDKNRYVWAASPSWGEKWKYAQDSHNADASYQPGADDAAITDADILATVQHLLGPDQPAE
jgi:hypothetical protein